MVEETRLQHKQLAEIASVQMGYPFRSRLESEESGGVGIVQMKDVPADRLVTAPHDLIRTCVPGAEHYFLEPGDIVFRSRGQTNTAALITVDLGPAVLAAPLMRLRTISPQVLPDYLAWYINQPTSQGYLRSELQGTSVLMISTDSLKAMKVTIPSLGVQKAIVTLAALGANEQRLMEEVAALRRRQLESILWRYAQEAG